MCGTGVEPVGGRHLADLAEVHDRHAVADVLHDREVVGDEDQRQPVALLEVLEQVEDLRLHRHVQGRHRLVADHQLGLEDQGAGDADALALPARELVGSLVARHVGVEPDRLEHLVDAGPALVLAAPAPDLERRPDDVADPAAGVERRDRVLEHDLHLRPQDPQPLPVQRRELVAGERHLAAGRLGQLDDGPGGGGLAAAGLADQAQRLTLGDVEAHVRHRRDVPPGPGREVHDQVLDPEEHVVVRAQVGGPAAGHQASTSATLVTSPVTASCGLRHLGGQVALQRLAPGVGADRVPAAVDVAGLVGLDERWLLLAAAVLGVRAARREPAARGRVDEVGRPAGDDVEPGVARVLEPRDRLQQRRGVRHPHLGEQGLGRRLLHDLAGVHHRDLVGVAGHDPEVVGDEHHRHLAVALLLAQQVEDLRLHGHVERGGGLVREQQLGAARQRHRDHDPLAHAAGQLVRVLAQPPRRLGDVDRLEQRQRGLLRLGAIHVEVEVAATR